MYNPYQSYNPFPQVQFPQNVLPAQQILQANGKASIDALKMAPNSSVLIMDSTAPIVWLCTSDGLGNVSSIAYDITTHKEAPAPNSLETRLTNVETSITQIMEELSSVKSNAGGAKSKQTVRANVQDSTD